MRGICLVMVWISRERGNWVSFESWIVLSHIIAGVLEYGWSWIPEPQFISQDLI